ncbi:MAG: deoxyribodipyrimidine photo-lyase [Candidatus Woesearchaeota archaeon]
MEKLSDRIRRINGLDYSSGKIIYWMSRDQRVKNNWSLIYAIKKANEFNVSLEVVFCLDNNYDYLNRRNFDFMIKGLKEVESDLNSSGINLKILLGSPIEKIYEYIFEKNVGFLITDFSPLKVKLNCEKEIDNKIKIPFHKVDSHNIIPVWIASNKKEYAAYTIRKKIDSKLDDYLTDFPNIELKNKSNLSKNNWDIIEGMDYDKSVKPIKWLKPGSNASYEVLENFIKNKLNNYSEYSNDPSKDYSSHLSPYLHFGQISAQFIAISVLESSATQKSKDEFLEQLIVRRELSDNFCYYEKNYDGVKGFTDWAKKTLKEHNSDLREFNYSLKELENAKTHDEYWNAAQLELLNKGKIHSYMRMYWAKKILEWTPSYVKAHEIAIHLNDKYSIDGRDPNGFVGVSWAVGGVHDRAFKERSVYGKIRYMSKSGLDRKFNMEDYVKNINQSNFNNLI